jgi:hypothetical protein
MRHPGHPPHREERIARIGNSVQARDLWSQPEARHTHHHSRHQEQFTEPHGAGGSSTFPQIDAVVIRAAEPSAELPQSREQSEDPAQESGVTIHCVTGEDRQQREDGRQASVIETRM